MRIKFINKKQQIKNLKQENQALKLVLDNLKVQAEIYKEGYDKLWVIEKNCLSENPNITARNFKILENLQTPKAEKL